MRILVICDVLAPQTTGGAGRLARELAEALKRRGHQIQFLTRHSEAVPPDHETSYFPAFSHALTGRYRNRFQMICARFKPHVIHAHQPRSLFFAMPRTLSAPLVYTFHSSWAEEWKVKQSKWPRAARRITLPLYQVIERRVLRRAAAVTALSRFSRQQLDRLYGRPALVIPGGVNSSRFRPTAISRTDGRVRLVSLRNLVPRMGLELLIEAMSRVGSHFSLEIGGEGPLKQRLQKQINRLGLSDRVRLLGHVAEATLPDFYCRADWFVLPTTALEGFGLVILESLSCGTPVLGTRVGAIPELLEPFDPRWIVEGADAASLAEAVTRADQLTAPDRGELHRRVAAEFDWSLIAAQYETLFRDCIGTSRSPARAAAGKPG